MKNTQKAKYTNGGGLLTLRLFKMTKKLLRNNMQ